MKFRITFIQIASFTAGAVLPSLIYGILAFLFVVTTFSFSGQKLSEKENTDAFVFFSIVIIVFATYYVMFKKYRSGKKFTAAGIAIAGLIPIYGLFIQEKFMSATWLIIKCLTKKYGWRVKLSHLRWLKHWSKNILL